MALLGLFLKQRPTLALAWLFRILLIVFGEWQDSQKNVNFTDVDYRVFTDAARHMWNGGSPYDRLTYRYSPLLSFLLLPNVFLHPCWGKVLFCSADILVGWILCSLLKSRGCSESEATKWSCLWLFNPLTMTISARGNADTLICLLAVLLPSLLSASRFWWCGIILGAAVHFRIFPVVFALPILLWIWKHHSVSSIFRWIGGGVVSIAALTAVFYFLYGYEFLDNTYLYHFARIDAKHNFSVFFLPLYLGTGSRYLHLLAFVPQAVALLVAGLRLHSDIPLACFAQTVLFVTFNKVCTAQYFSWYWCWLPLVLPRLEISAKKAACMAFCWLSSEVHWLAWGYMLEFQGLPVFLEVWGASLLFFLVNCWCLTEILRSYRTPRFDAKKEA